ncbi:glutamate--tRNA ligase family protein, partial [Staphylococcus aureus]|nr:glutamate--tRNA ligase family protein [Staphylococcus aureus]
NPPLFRALALRRKQTLLTLHSLNMLHSRGFLAEVFSILARHNISVDLITTSEVSVALTLDTTGSTSTGDTLLTQALLTELSSLCRVEVEENLALFEKMRAGGFEEGKACLRAKIDMASPFIVMRDPVLYRIKFAEHHQTGNKWCIYPMYDFTHCISDALEGITHSLCTLEFQDNRRLYDW